MLYPGLQFASALIAASSCALAQDVTLLVSTDLECRLSIDGNSKGVLKVDDPIPVTLGRGEHLVQAVSTSGGARWEKIINLNESTPPAFKIPMQAANSEAELANRGYWIDADTRLMWEARDNGYDVNWAQAGAYCKNLTIGGYRDWTLPTIEELEGLRSGETPKGGVKVRGWAWSSSQGTNSGEAWHYVFGYGARYSREVGHTNVERALCVRHTGE